MSINVYEILYSLLVSGLLSKYDSVDPANYALLATAVFGAILVFFLKEKLNKTKYEESRKQKVMEALQKAIDSYEKPKDP